MENDIQLSEFKKKDMALRMSMTAEKFKIPNNQQLFKKKISTGFESIDAVLNGGLAPGLHAIAAGSSMGKSTLVMQIAEHMSAMGAGVVVFSQEMDRINLTAKAVSRQTYLDYPNSSMWAQESETILSEEKTRKFTKLQWQTIHSLSYPKR